MDTKQRKHGRRYPWHIWFSCGRFVLHKGLDYTARTDTMAQQVRHAAAANRYGLRVSIEIAPDARSLTVTVLGPLKEGVE